MLNQHGLFTPVQVFVCTRLSNALSCQDKCENAATTKIHQCENVKELGLALKPDVALAFTCSHFHLNRSLASRLVLLGKDCK